MSRVPKICDDTLSLLSEANANLQIETKFTEGKRWRLTGKLAFDKREVPPMTIDPIRNGPVLFIMTLTTPYAEIQIRRLSDEILVEIVFHNHPDIVQQSAALAS